MTHSIEAIQLADLAARATEIAQRTDNYARIVCNEGRYEAVNANAQAEADVYVVFPDGVVEPWDDAKYDQYDERVLDMIIE